MRFLFALLAVFAAAPAVLPAAGVLVYIEETGDVILAQNGHPIRDEVLAGLFDRGYIVFDPGEDSVGDVAWASGETASLLRAAVEGGAGVIVVARSEARATKREQGRPVVEASLVYFVLRVSESGANAIASGSLSASNRGKEEEVSAEAVVHELGASLAAAVYAVAPQGAGQEH